MLAAVWPGQGQFRLVAGTGFEPARGFDAGTSPVVQTAAALGPGLLGWVGLDRAARDLAAPAAFRRHPCRGRVRPPLRRGSERDRSPRSPRRADRRGGPLPRFADTVDRLGCLRGISALTGLALTVEIGDWTRFTGSSIGAYVGLVPCASTPQAPLGCRGRSPRPATATCAGCWWPTWRSRVSCPAGAGRRPP